jgi:transcriptional regulator with XRE-family HTH domain
MVEKGWNQSELARRAEMQCNGKRLGRDNVSVYIRGKVLPGPLHLSALAKALGLKPADLLPTRGTPEAGESSPSMDVRDMGDGRAWLRINQAIDWDVALKILEMLKGK